MDGTAEKCGAFLIQKVGERLELSLLVEEVKKIFETEDISKLSEKLFDICINNKTEYYDKFIELVEDLSIDWLQKIFQYYEADRTEKMQDYTPLSLAKFIGKLTEHEEEKTVLDLCAGSGALTIQKWNLKKELQFVCLEYDDNVIPFLLFNLAVRNIDAVVIHGDALSGEVYKKYEVAKRYKYSSIKENSSTQILKANSCISNPPYNMKFELPPFAQLQPRFSNCELPPENNANYAFVLTALDNMTSKASMILPNGVLATQNKQERAIRKYLIDNNFIESIILCPDKMFEATNIPTCIVTFSKVKADAYICMVDMRKTFAIEKREQNGQWGGASKEKRTYVKEVKVFLDEHMMKAIDCIENKSNINEFSKAVSIKDVESNDYILTPSRYIEFQEREATHREYAEIVADVNRIIRDKNTCKLTINKTLARSIGFDLDLYKTEHQTNAELNNLLIKLGADKLLKHDYFSATKNKNEIKFENKDKDQLSSILIMIMQTWKQHIYYLNQEENRYLAELRDALLPDLMNGKIKITE